MKKYTIRQGNSLWLSITGDIAVVDDTWENWTGTWLIRDKTTKTTQATGELSRSSVPGVFIAAVPPASTAVLAPAEYDLLTQVENIARNYRDEWKPDLLIVEEQGITP